MDTIAIIHNQDKTKRLSESLKEIPHMAWQTCLREIVFISKQDSYHLPMAHKVLYDHKAYSEILEIICGLQSPILGETQVFGQFKHFLKQQLDLENSLLIKNRNYFQNLLTEAKTIREASRGLLKSSGYGSITRKLLRGKENVALIGTGELAGEIFALLQKNAHCTVYNRSTHKPFFDAIPQSLDHLGTHHDAVVIAAPVSNVQIQAGIQNSALIIDWRAEQTIEQIAPGQKYYNIHDLFKIHEEEKLNCHKVADAIRLKIQQRTQSYFERVSIRPQGWEDVCA